MKSLIILFSNSFFLDIFNDEIYDKKYLFFLYELLKLEIDSLENIDYLFNRNTFAEKIILAYF